MILIGSGHSRLDAGVIFSKNEAPARARAWFPKCVVEGRATTTTAPARYFLTICSDTPWPERLRMGPGPRSRGWASVGPRWSSLWGHDPREGCAEMGGGTPCEPCRWGLRWCSLWVTILVRGVPKRAGGRHANPVAGAFRRAPCGATILVRGVPKWPEAAMRTLPLGPSVELPMGPRSS